ncbi:MAG: YlxR family protein [Anaerolineaceae bacterium]|nr:YlxR family protein [Anaerolineaceae bacterium]
MKKHNRHNRHIPQRTCIGCWQVLSKKELMRIIRTPEGIRYDPTGKANGRGAYLHRKKSCWQRALKGSLAKTLRTEMTEKDQSYLLQIMNSLPEE